MFEIVVIYLSTICLIGFVILMWFVKKRREEQKYNERIRAKEEYYSGVIEAVSKHLDLYISTIGLNSLLLADDIDEFIREEKLIVYQIITTMVENKIILLDDEEVVKLIAMKTKRMLNEISSVINKKRSLDLYRDQDDFVRTLINTVSIEAAKEAKRRKRKKSVREIDNFVNK